MDPDTPVKYPRQLTEQNGGPLTILQKLAHASDFLISLYEAGSAQPREVDVVELCPGCGIISQAF